MKRFWTGSGFQSFEAVLGSVGQHLSCKFVHASCRTLPINQIFRYLQNRSRVQAFKSPKLQLVPFFDIGTMSKLFLGFVQVWLHEQADLRIEGRILGFDEYSLHVLSIEVQCDPAFTIYLLDVLQKPTHFS